MVRSATTGATLSQEGQGRLQHLQEEAHPLRRAAPFLVCLLIGIMQAGQSANCTYSAACLLRGFECSYGKIDLNAVLPAQILAETPADPFDCLPLSMTGRMAEDFSESTRKRLPFTTRPLYNTSEKWLTQIRPALKRHSFVKSTMSVTASQSPYDLGLDRADVPWFRYALVQHLRTRIVRATSDSRSGVPWQPALQQTYLIHRGAVLAMIRAEAAQGSLSFPTLMIAMGWALCSVSGGLSRVLAK
jgi:hypothetical protein